MVICSHLKDVFFCLQLAPVSQPLFAPEWENTHGKQETALLDEAFKNSPTLFSRALATDFVNFSGQELERALLK